MSENTKVVELRGVKGFTGIEGRGLNATLFFNGRRAAFIIDSADGGDMDIDWDRSWPTAEAEVLAYCKTLPMPEWAKSIPTYKDDTGLHRLEGLIGRLADEYENDKRLRRMCSKKIVIETPESKAKGQLIIFKMPYSPKAVALVKSKHPDCTVINERFAPKAPTPEQWCLQQIEQRLRATGLSVAQIKAQMKIERQQMKEAKEAQAAESLR